MEGHTNASDRLRPRPDQPHPRRQGRHADSLVQPRPALLPSPLVVPSTPHRRSSGGPPCRNKRHPAATTHPSHAAPIASTTTSTAARPHRTGRTRCAHCTHRTCCTSCSPGTTRAPRPINRSTLAHRRAAHRPRAITILRPRAARAHAHRPASLTPFPPPPGSRKLIPASRIPRPAATLRHEPPRPVEPHQSARQPSQGR